MRRVTRRARLLLSGIVILTILTILAFMLWRNLFVVRNVIIEGTVSASEEELIRAAQIDMGGSIHAIDEDALRQNLNATGRYELMGVNVRMPNTVILSVRERTRDAMVLNGGQILVMDAQGYVIEACSSMPEDGGVYITGLDGTSYRIGGRIAAQEVKLSAMQTVLETVRAQNAGQYVSELSVEDVLNLYITTRTGIRVELGDAENMEGKILWMCSAVADLESRGSTKGTLDVSSGTKADYRP